MTQLTHYYIDYRSYRVSYLLLLTWLANGKRILFTVVLDVTIPPEKINKSN